MSRRGVVVLLEGSEQCGKTVLADKIHDKFKSDYLHGDRPDNRSFKDFHTEMMQSAVWMARAGHVVVLDRCYISHEVYNNMFDGKTEYNTREFHDNACIAIGGGGMKLLVVYCNPKREFDPNMREEMYDDSKGDIQKAYEKVIKDYSEHCEFLAYDWTKDPEATEVLNKIEELHNGK